MHIIYSYTNNQVHKVCTRYEVSINVVEGSCLDAQKDKRSVYIQDSTKAVASYHLCERPKVNAGESKISCECFSLDLCEPGDVCSFDGFLKSGGLWQSLWRLPCVAGCRFEWADDSRTGQSDIWLLSACMKSEPNEQLSVQSQNELGFWGRFRNVLEQNNEWWNVGDRCAVIWRWSVSVDVNLSMKIEHWCDHGDDRWALTRIWWLLSWRLKHIYKHTDLVQHIPATLAHGLAEWPWTLMFGALLIIGFGILSIWCEKPFRSEPYPPIGRMYSINWTTIQLH